MTASAMAPEAVWATQAAPKGCEKPVPGRAVPRRRAPKLPDFKLQGMGFSSQSDSGTSLFAQLWHLRGLTLQYQNR